MGRRIFHSDTGILALALLALISGCSSDSTGPTGNTAATSVPGQLADLPAGVSSTDYEIVAGADSCAVGSDGQFRVEMTRADAVQAVLALDAGDRPVHVTLHRPAGGGDLQLDASETAYSLVLMHPLLMTTDPELLGRAREVIAGLDSFADLVTALRTRIADGYRLGDPDAQVEGALGTVYADYVDALIARFRAGLPDKDQGPFNGLVLQGPEVTGNELNYALLNRLKRWISVYAATIDQGGMASDFQFVELMPSPQVSLLQLLLDGFQLPEVQGDRHTVALDGLDAVEIRCYGLGGAVDLQAGDFGRMVEPMVCSIVFDIGLPIASVLAGGEMELRGRPRNHPLYYFIEHAGSNCPELSAALYDGIRNQRMPDIVFPLVDCFTSQIIDHPRIFADAINQIILDQLGAAVARRVVNSWLWPIRVVNAVVTGFNVGWTLVSISSAEAVTTFRLDVGAGPEFVSTVYGHVRDAASDLPLAGASVSLRYYGGSAIATTLTDAEGGFEIGAPAGTLLLTCSMPGYQAVTHYLEVSPTAPMTTYLPTHLLAIPSDELGAFGGDIIDAATGQGIAGATVTVRRGLDIPDAAVLFQTDSNGNGTYLFEGVEPGSYTVTAGKDGYIEQSIYVTVVGGSTQAFNDITISALLNGEVRFVLTWGQVPDDLDSHLVTPSIDGSAYQVLWTAKGSLVSPPFAQLDVDDVTSYGPETITVGQAFPGVYRYAVYQWSQSGSLPTSAAGVALYAGNTRIREWSVPTQGSGRWWYVCDFDIEDGQIVEHNVLQDNAPPGMSVSKDGLLVKTP